VGRGGHDDSVSYRPSPLIPPSPLRGEGVKRRASLTKCNSDRVCSLTILAALSALLFATPAAADQVADFYRGKSLSMIIATSPGGDYDIRARLVARHMGRHIPGEPAIIPRNMPGAVGLQAANYLAVQAPRDGTVLHAIMQAMSAYQAMGGPNVEYDTRRMAWIGNTTNSPNVVSSWYSTGIKTIQDVMQRELVVGAPGTNTASVYYPRIMNALVGTKFKIVPGYPGGNDVNLAMERGEVGGRGSNSWASWKATHQDWITQKKIYILVQIALARSPELADVPLMTELARDEDDRKVLAFVSADTEINRAVVTTPDTPPERVETLRRAFDATMRDPLFLAEAQKAGMDINPSTGEEAQRVADFIANTPSAVVSRAKALLEN
jgi:tripartite-type tricarboxylate transporter receptor subunit TctC